MPTQTDFCPAHTVYNDQHRGHHLGQPTALSQLPPRTTRNFPTKIAVIGSRSWGNWTRFQTELDTFLADLYVECLVSGGADGADAFAQRYALERGIPMKVFPALWDRYGERAGPKRNKLIVEFSDSIIAFWDGVSHGTRKTVDLARALGKTVTVILADRTSV